MSCFVNNVPNPPRTWSRVENACSITDDYKSPLYLAEKNAMLNKGNILQYKANSSNLTKSQKYSKIAKGQWVNRNTTWAIQSSRGYTNPNTTSLKRSGNVNNIAIDPITGAIIGTTYEPPTCPQSLAPVNETLPSNGGGGSDVNDPNIPPPVDPTPASDTFPPIIPDTPINPLVIQDGGSLICSVQENICTGETKSSIAQQLCHPTTDSNVPGPIQELCWNDGTQTWYPRSRYIMNNNNSIIEQFIAENQFNVEQFIINNQTNVDNTYCYNLDLLINSSIIVKIRNMFEEYNNNIKDVANYNFNFSLIIYDDLKIELEELRRTLNNSCVSKMIPIFQDILKNIYNGSLLATSYITETNNSMEYKLAYDILHNPLKLQEYITTLNNNTLSVIPDVSITSVKATIKPKYQIYITLYGTPPDLDFNPSKLTDIVNAINKYNDIYGAPVNDNYEIDLISQIINNKNK